MVTVEPDGTLRDRGAHHLLLRRLVLRAPTGTSRSVTASGSATSRSRRSTVRYAPGRLGGARLERRAEHVRRDADRRRLSHRLALPGVLGGAHVHDRLPAQQPRDRLRRRRRRRPQRLGRPVGPDPAAADRRAHPARAGERPFLARLGPPGLRAGRRHPRRTTRCSARGRPAEAVRRAAGGVPPQPPHLDGGTRVRTGRRADRGSWRRRQAEAAAFERDQEKIRSALDNLPRTIAILLAARASCPRSRSLGATYWFYGRERKTATTGSTSRSRPRSSSPRSSRRSCASPRRSARSSSPPRSSTSSARAATRPRPSRPEEHLGRASARRRSPTSRSAEASDRPSRRRGAGHEGDRRRAGRRHRAALELP